MRTLFISYARENKRDVTALVDHLTVLGCQTWVDASLRGGQDWWQEILQRLAGCDGFVAVISGASLNSVACQREYEWAHALAKPVLPIAIEALPRALPRRFSMLQIVDYFRPDHQAALTLAGAVAALPAAPPLPDPMPQPPAAPLSYLTDLVDLVAQTAPLDHEEQRQIVYQLGPALRSVDPEERRGGQDILRRFRSRDDLYADVDKALTDLGATNDDSATQVHRLRPAPRQPQHWAHQPTPQGSNPPTPTTPAPNPPGPTPPTPSTQPASPGSTHPRPDRPPAPASDPAPPAPAEWPDHRPASERPPQAEATPSPRQWRRPWKRWLTLPLGAPTPRRRRIGLILAVVAVIVIASGAIGGWLLLGDRGGAPGPVGALEGQPIVVGQKPYDIAGGGGFVWTTNTGEATISKVDPATGTAEQIEVGGAPYELVVTADAVWVWNFRTAVTRVSIATGEADRPIPAGAADIAGIAAGGGYVWLSHTDNTVTRIDTNIHVLVGAPIPVGKTPKDMAFGDNILYVLNTGDRTISGIDSTGTVRGDPLQIDAQQPGGIDVVDHTIYVGTGNAVSVIDEESWAIGKSIPVMGGGFFCPDGKGIWVTFPVTNELRWFDNTGAEARGGPITGIGKGILGMKLLDHTLWLVDQPNNSVRRVKVR